MNTYSTLQSLCEALGMRFYEIPECSDQEIQSQIIPEENTPAPFKGQKHTEESRELMRVANLGKVLSDETRAKMSAARKGTSGFSGKKHSEETLAKIRKAKAGNTAFLGKKHTPETLAKISESRKKAYARERSAKSLILQEL